MNRFRLWLYRRFALNALYRKDYKREGYWTRKAYELETVNVKRALELARELADKTTYRDADDDVAREMLLEAYRAMFRLRP